MKIAYADPPYIGQAKKHYASKEIDHKHLIQTTLAEYDAWALSCSSPSLRILLPLCPDGTRIAAWVKPFCIFKPNVNPAYAWEPILFYGVRKTDRTIKTVRDFTSCNITLRKGIVGAKPKEFALWLMCLLKVKPSDVFHDLFPGTGIITKTHKEYITNWAEKKEITT